RGTGPRNTRPRGTGPRNTRNTRNRGPLISPRAQADLQVRHPEDVMQRTIVRVVIALGLVAAGWSIGRAQSGQPDFVLVVDRPAGSTSIECRRGCTLAWVERDPAPAGRAQTFSFSCGGPSVQRCSSYQVGGWIGR